MLIETYKGVQIHHNGQTDEFYTDIVLNTTLNGKKEYIRNGRLQKIREQLDKFLNTVRRIYRLNFKNKKYSYDNRKQ